MKKQAGFTLIELIMVIVILGILAATALPKFANLQNDARYASAKGAQGAISSAAALVHSALLVAGSSVTAAAGSAVVEGATINVAYGYPDASANGIQLAAGITSTDYTISANGTSPQTFAPKGVGGGNISTTANTAAGCNAIYTIATAASPATVGLAGTSSANCN